MIGENPRLTSSHLQRHHTGNILKREGSVVYLLDFVHDAYPPKVALELLKEVIDFPCVPCLIVGWSLEHINLRGGRHLAWATDPHVAHRGHAYLELSLQGLNLCLIGFRLYPTSFKFLFLGGFKCSKSLDLLVDIGHYRVYSRLHLSTKLFKSPCGL